MTRDRTENSRAPPMRHHGFKMARRVSDTYYPGSQAPFWGEEVTSPAIVGLNTFLVRLCHPIEGLGGLLTKYFWRDG